MSVLQRKLLAAGIVLACPAVAMLTWLMCVPYLPSQLPDAWDWWQGGVDYPVTTSRAFVRVLIPSALFVVVAIVLILLSKPDKVWRRRIAVLTFAVSMNCVFWIKTFVFSLGADTLAETDPALWQFLLVTPLIGWPSVVILKVLPAPTRPEPNLTFAPLALHPGERVVWSGRTTSRFGWDATCVYAALFAFGVVLAVTVGWPALVPLALPGLHSWLRIGWVRVDEEGVHFGRGWWRWLSHVIPLQDISVAGPVEMENKGFDGWRFQNSPEAEQVAYWTRAGTTRPDVFDFSNLLRPGEALMLERHGKLPLALSVDHADEAADVVNALIARNRGSRQRADEMVSPPH